MKRSFWFRKIAGFMVLGAAAAALFIWIVMLLWNNVLAAVVSVGQVSFWQAGGILLLSKILFGGFGGRGMRRHEGKWGRGMKEKWNNMTPEERERFKQDWRDRCGTWGRSRQQATDVAKDDAATQNY